MPCITSGWRVAFDFNFDPEQDLGGFVITEFGDHLRLRPSTDPLAQDDLSQVKTRLMLKPEVIEAAGPGKDSIFSVSFETRLPYHNVTVKDPLRLEEHIVIDGERLLSFDVSTAIHIHCPDIAQYWLVTISLIMI